jgi:hypothetical protein
MAVELLKSTCLIRLRLRVRVRLRLRLRLRVGGRLRVRLRVRLRLRLSLRLRARWTGVGARGSSWEIRGRFAGDRRRSDRGRLVGDGRLGWCTLRRPSGAMLG